jgi:hypothetical protein
MFDFTGYALLHEHWKLGYSTKGHTTQDADQLHDSLY